VIKHINVADLHVHTTASDGAFSLAEVVALARSANLEIIAVTDHDSVGALASPPPPGVEIIPGVEFSAGFREREAHVLGYFIDPARPALCARLADLQDRRRARLDDILAKLRALDISIDAEEILDVAAGSVGRLHVAELLVSQGHAAGVYEAFRDFLGPYGKAFVPKTHLTVAEAIGLVHAAGGAAVLAHPGGFFTDDDALGFVGDGLDGIECHYPSHALYDTERWLALAAREGLVVTGGSDFHGRAISPVDLGAIRISRADGDAVRERSRRYGVRLP
jgi:hypothetical protein